MARLHCHQFHCLNDNYGVLVHDAETGATASIDAPDGEAVLAALSKTGWTLSDIFVTHHHWDHVQGIEAVKAATGATVTGPAGEADKIPGLDRAVGGGDSVALGRHAATIIDVPGHTNGHIAYWFEYDRLAFTGDALFAMGCGRMFEGKPGPMWAGLDRLRQLPDETEIYCGHEYTLANARFARSVDPDNADLAARFAEVERLRAADQPTLPTTMGLEKRTNPFLRVDNLAIRTGLDMADAEKEAVFAALRAAKDRF